MISVCMATHNGEKYIKEQLDSILTQLNDDDEIIISDDGSKDSTLSIIQGYNDDRIKLLHYSHSKTYKHSNIYAAHNFEYALKHAKGDFIFLSDQDDVWCPDKVTVCLKELKHNDLVIHNLLNADERLNPYELHFKNGFRWNNFLILKDGYHGCAMAFRRTVLDYALPFPQYLPLHDYWIGFLTELIGKVKFIDGALMYYRLHGENVSRYKHNPVLYKISHRIYVATLLYARFIKWNFKKYRQ